LGLKILSTIGVTKTFVGTPIKQFDRIYQFTIKYPSESSSNLYDTALLLETDVEKFLDVCSQREFLVGVFPRLTSEKSSLSYDKAMKVKTNILQTEGLYNDGKVRVGQPILVVYQYLRVIYARDQNRFHKLVSAVVSTNRFAMSFRAMMRDLNRLSVNLG